MSAAVWKSFPNVRLQQPPVIASGSLSRFDGRLILHHQGVKIQPSPELGPVNSLREQRFFGLLLLTMIALVFSWAETDPKEIS